MSSPLEQPQAYEAVAQRSRPSRHDGASAVRAPTAPAKAADERPRLVFFTASTSGPCRQAESWIAQVMQLRRNYLKIKLVTVDTVERPELADRFRIERLPTLVVVENNTAKARLEAPRGTHEITALLAPWLV